jgi:hypothetical protein
MERAGLLGGGRGRHTDLQEKDIKTFSDIPRSKEKGKDYF